MDWIAIATIALVSVTGYYAWSTHKILKESQRTRDAVERQAKALEESNRLLNERTIESISLGKVIVRTTIKTSRTFWKGGPSFCQEDGRRGKGQS